MYNFGGPSVDLYNLTNTCVYKKMKAYFYEEYYICQKTIQFPKSQG